VDEAKYGCGPLLHPGHTYYVKPDGDNQADGLSWSTAWSRIAFAVPRLKPGDTLLLREGEYHEHLGFRRDKLLGEPGRPIRIMAAPRHRVVISGAKRVGPFRRLEGTRFTYETGVKKPKDIELYTGVWEDDSLTVLEPAASVEEVERLPGTHFFDTAADKLYVRFSDARPGEGRYVRVFRYHRGLCVHGRYVLVKGIWVKHTPFYAVDVGGQHCTFEDCVVFANWGCGFHVGKHARWNLLRCNYGFANEDRGTIRSYGDKCTDNLYLNNRCDPSPASGRSGKINQHWCINNYGGLGARCHLIGNILNDGRSSRWKPAVRGTVFQGNVAIGAVYCTGTAKLGSTDLRDRMILRGNTILGGVSWSGEPLGPGGFAGDWADSQKVSVNNFMAGGDRATIDAARFADPAWLDYRLQSDSPLVGKAIGGGDRGAFRSCRDRIFYVGPKGDDSAAGTSARLAFKTLGHACEELRAGDTLYVMAGDYTDTLVVSASGTADRPIQVRAFQKKRFTLPGIAVKGSNVQVEGFRVANGIVVRGSDVRVQWCVGARAEGAGLLADGAKGLTVNHCTFAHNARGIVLNNGSADVTLRNCIVAHNSECALAIDAASKPGYRGYSTCYFGPGLDAGRIAAEPDSIVADPRFADADRGDYRLSWDSPARYLGEFAPPAGAEPTVPRQAKIAGVEIINVQRDSAVIRWQTPEDDATGLVRFRPKGASKWQSVKAAEQGTDHAAGLVGLEPETEYEFQVAAKNRRGADAASDVLTFHTVAESRAATKLYVSPAGDDAADGRSPKTAWRTLRRASIQALPGDTVLIAPGVYHGIIAPIATGLPGRRITFKRFGDGEAVIDGGQVRGRLCVLARRSFITIDGLTFQACIPKGYPPAHICISDARDVEILNCRTRRLAGRSCAESIVADRVQGLRIEGNVFSGQRYNLRSWSGSSDFIIRNNTFGQHSVMAFAIKSTPNVTIVNNIFCQPKGRGCPYIGLWVDRLDCGLVLDHNLYAPAPNMRVVDLREYRQTEGGRTETLTIAGDTLAHWQQQSGHGKHSLWADPMFVDVAKGDFRLRPGSPAIGAGPDGATMGACGVATLEPR